MRHVDIMINIRSVPGGTLGFHVLFETPLSLRIDYLYHNLINRFWALTLIQSKFLEKNHKMHNFVAILELIA